MLRKIKIELMYFMLILLILAVVQHSDLLHSPLERLGLMAEKGNYLHPFLWSFVVYFIVAIARLIVAYLLRFKKKS